jgi:anti-sigma regulatory factor (Ser/Thr protein kinase)
VYRISPTHSLLLAADVSGHDLKAAYISSYFQGIVRGMIEKSAPPRQILEFFNRFLLSEWNSQDEKFSLRNNAQTSICVCCALIGPDNQIISLTNNGFPAPVFIGSDGSIVSLGETTGPLGWFEDQCLQEIDLPSAQNGYLFLWSDGMEDFARRHGIAPCAVAYRLLHPARNGEEVNFLADIADDISLARLNCGARETGRDVFQPVFLGSYAGDEAIKINEFQAGWEKSVLFALPNLSVSQLYDPLLCSREALLNALIHGCKTEPTLSSVVQISYQPSQNILRVRVDDPGSGYDQPSEIAQDYLSQHCGLKLLKTLPNRLTVSRGGATLTMDFDLGERTLTLNSR